MKKKVKFLKIKKKSNLIILISIFLVLFSHCNSISKDYYNNKNSIYNNINNPRIGGFIWAQLDLTNPIEINNSQFPHYMSINIEGRVYNPLDPFIDNEDLNVAIVVDSEKDSRYTGITDSNGDFIINYIVDPSLDVYSNHKIEAIVTDPEPGGPESEVFYHHYYIIDVNATSYLDPIYTDIPYIPGESLALSGYLRYNNENGTGIPNAQINYHWFNSTNNWSSNSFFTSPSDGSLIQDIKIPTNVFNQTISLNLSYSGDLPRIGSSEIVIPNIILFSNVTCIWNIVDKASEDEIITIAGQLISMSNSSIKISNRTLIFSFGGIQIDTVTTDSNGYFAYEYTVPSGIGIILIEIKVVNTAELVLPLITNINITAAPYVPSNPTGLPPFLMFSLIFFPILGGITAALAVLGYRFYKKQEKESRVVSLPLESKLINLKILKDSGRLEESISYLFNAIYIDLVDAKYGRSRKENETIRDFAIISVKELKLTPATIYPFIQKVEEIIYAKPFKITENDFYKMCELFSPVYFQLTGYNFQLNF